MANNRNQRFLHSASLLVMACAAAPALAQSQSADSTGGDIVVTARRTEERLQDVPISITVYNQQQIQNRNIVTAADLATYTPSLTANSRFGPESTSFAIRGFVQEGITSPSVAVYFADVVAPRANGGTTSGNGAGVGSLFDLQNVQVLKGPQGTLFGRNTTGGAVLLVPQKPTGAFGGYVEGSYGNYDMKRAQAVLNVPVMDSLRIRIGVDRQKRDGYINNVSGIGPRHYADTDYIAVRVSAVADLTDNLENYTIATYSRSNTNGFAPKMFFALPGTYRFAENLAQIRRTANDYYNVETGMPNPGQIIEQHGVINTLTWRASDTITLKNIASYTEFQQQQSSPIYGENGYDPTVNASNYAVDLFAAPRGHNVSQSTFTEEVQLQGRSTDDRLTYQAGAYYELSEPLDGFQRSYSGTFIRCADILQLQCTDIRGRLTPLVVGGRVLGTLEGRVGSVNISRSRYRFRNIGVYAQATYKLTDQLSVTGGIRYTDDSTFGRGQSIRANFFAPNVPTLSCAQPAGIVRGGTSAQIADDPSRCEFVRTAKSKKPTWLADVDFKPVEDVLLYAKYARGYRQGSINVSSYGLETWGPEKVDTYEVGAKTGFRSFVSGTFNVAAFYNDFSNQQLQLATVNCQAADLIANPTQCPFQPSAGAGIANAGKSVIKGVEVDGAITLFRGLNVSGSYAYLKTKLKSATLPAVPLGFIRLISPVVGGPLPLTPKNKFTVTTSYTLPLDESIGQISVSGTYTYQSKQLGSTSSLSAAQLVALVGASSDLAGQDFQILPGQENLNLNLNWNKIAGSPIDLQLFATNVTKEKFRVQTVGGASSFGFESFILNPPRMYGARLRYTFGG